MKNRFTFLWLLVIVLVVSVIAMRSAGALQDASFGFTQPASIDGTAASIAKPSRPGLWVSASVPATLREAARAGDLPVAPDRASASVVFDAEPDGKGGSVWVYALVAPFPTVLDGVTFNELLSSWKGSPAGPFAGRPLLMDDATRAAFSALWGTPAEDAVQIIRADQLLDTAWARRPSWAIVPFEELNPRWKVLTVDGQSPVRKGFQLVRSGAGLSPFDYPLAVTFALACSGPCPDGTPELPSANRDAAKLTTVVTTGVTALVRATAYVMNTKGITYPGSDIRDWLLDADVAHISNEVPFADHCPPPDPAYPRLVFCSDPDYIDLLRYIGADVIELTGNHYADYGPEAMRLTLGLYNANNMAHYGGGADLEDARKPLLLEDHGNRIAFIGCNSVDIGRSPTATATRPGAAPCDYDYMTARISSLSAQGYLVIASFQYYEAYSPTPFEAQVQDFRLMADAGAVVVQGSQAHNPESLEFDGGSLIHYGLGNLFFDQMGDVSSPTRQEFIDRHVFYAGRYIGTELLTAELEDYARPRPMTPEERAAFLAKYFAASGW